jgi:hypothetical protein
VAKPFTGTLTQIVIPTPELWGRNLLVALNVKNRFLALILQGLEMTKPFTGTLTQIVIPTPELWGEESAGCS